MPTLILWDLPVTETLSLSLPGYGPCRLLSGQNLWLDASSSASSYLLGAENYRQNSQTGMILSSCPASARLELNADLNEILGILKGHDFAPVLRMQNQRELYYGIRRGLQIRKIFPARLIVDFRE